MKVAFIIIIALAIPTSQNKTSDQVLALLQTGTKASDAIQSITDLLNELGKRNKEDQRVADEKQEINEYIAEKSYEQHSKIVKINQKLFTEAQNNTQILHKKLEQTKAEIAWIELYIEEQERKQDSLLDNQCHSNKLFLQSLENTVKSLKYLDSLKSDVGAFIDENDPFKLVQLKAQSIGEKLKQYSNLIQDYQIKSFMALAATEENNASGTEATLSEKILQLIEQLESEIKKQIESIQNNEIKASWELAGWVSLSKAEIANLLSEYEKKKALADRTAIVKDFNYFLNQQIQAALAQQAKSKIILQQSEDALNQVQAIIMAKRENYAAEKARRANENAILQEVMTIFKKQVASWSGR